jgi:hypothetical protein
VSTTKIAAQALRWDSTSGRFTLQWLPLIYTDVGGHLLNRAGRRLNCASQAKHWAKADRQAEEVLESGEQWLGITDSQLRLGSLVHQSSRLALSEMTGKEFAYPSGIDQHRPILMEREEVAEAWDCLSRSMTPDGRRLMTPAEAQAEPVFSISGYWSALTFIEFAAMGGYAIALNLSEPLPTSPSKRPGRDE